MEFAGDQLPRMNWESPALSEEWRKFKQHAELLFHGPLRSKTEEEKCCYLLIWVGDKGRDIYNSWSDMSVQDRDRLDSHYTRFDEWVTSKVNPIFARSKFYERRQSPGESLERFLSELNLLARDCDFADRDEMIRDRLVCGAYLQDVRKKLISEGSELDLKRAMEIAKIYELTQGRLELSTAGHASPFMDCTSLWGKRLKHERTGDEPPTPSESCDESGSSHETEEAQDFSETEQMDQDSHVKLTPVTFEDVSLSFSEKEWDTLKPLQKELYKDVMQENYETLVSLGYDIPKPEVLCLMEEGKGPCTGSAAEASVFVPVEEDVTESFLLSLIKDDDDDFSDPDPDGCDDMESTDDSVCSMPDVPELLKTSGPGKPQRRYTDETPTSVQEPSRNGKQWPSTMNCISTKPISNGPELNFTAEPGNLSRMPMETQIRVNGRASPALHQRTPTPDMKLQNKVFREQNHSQNLEKMKSDSTQPLKPCNNSTERVGSFHLAAGIPRLLNIKQEDLQNGFDDQPKAFLPMNLDIKEETEAIPICDESSQASTEITPPRPSTQTNKVPSQKATESERSSHSDTDSYRRHSTRIKEKDVAEQSNPLADHAKTPAEEGPAQTSRKRKSQSSKVAQVKKVRGKETQVKKDAPRKRGPKPSNRTQRPALRSRLPEQQVPLSAPKLYRCSKCQRTFGHYSQFIAHQRYEMRKKPPQRAESVKRPKKPQRSSSRNKRRRTSARKGEASTSKRVTRSSRKAGSKNKENDSSKSPQVDPRLRARKSYACDVCKESFPSRSGMVTHKGTNDEEVYHCSKCEALSAGRESNAVGTKYECGICQKAFVHNTGLVAHLRIHTGDKPHQCSECDQTFSYKSALIVHQRTHKKEKTPEEGEQSTSVPTKTSVANTGKVYPCPQCKEEFANSTLLYTHQQTHTGPKPHPCHYCDKSFNDKTLLSVHQKTHTGESPYQCGKCQKNFTSQSLLLAHGLTHTSGKPFQCDLCDKSFNGEALMLSHKKTHATVKTYQCVTCKEVFKAESLLAEHQKVHIEDKPHKCDYCEKGFNSASLLIAHRRIHTGEKAFHCHYCGEGFNTSSLLNVHLRNHAPEKPYPCDICERSFNLKSLLLAHRATHEHEKQDS